MIMRREIMEGTRRQRLGFRMSKNAKAKMMPTRRRWVKRPRARTTTAKQSHSEDSENKVNEK